MVVRMVHNVTLAIRIAILHEDFMSDDSDPPKSLDSDPPESDPPEREITGIHSIPHEMRPWARSQSKKLRKVEKHFEDGGMVAELHSDWTAVKKGVGFFKWFAPMVGAAVVACIMGIVYLVNHAATQPPPPPRAEEVAREVLKQQAQQPK